MNTSLPSTTPFCTLQVSSSFNVVTTPVCVNGSYRNVYDREVNGACVVSMLS